VKNEEYITFIQNSELKEEPKLSSSNEEKIKKRLKNNSTP